MDRKLILPSWIIGAVCVLICFVARPASAQTAVLYDSFEGYNVLSNKWTVYDAFDPEAPILDGWGIVNSSFGGNEGVRYGTNKLYCSAVRYNRNGGTTSSPRYPDETTASVMERAIDLTGYTEATLSFWYKVKIPETELFVDYFEVYIDDYLVFSSDFLDGPVTAWTHAVIPINDVVGEPRTLRFVFNTDNANDPDPEMEPPLTESMFEGVYIDDILVNAAPVYKPDFDENMSTDILWQNTNGLMVAWFMEGTTLQKTLILRNGQKLQPGWTAVGTTDIDFNGTTDILFQHSTSLIAVWYMNATNVIAARTLPNAGQGWKLSAITDFDNDGKRDFLWQHTNGQIGLWRMNGTNVLQKLSVRNGVAAAVGFVLVGANDFNWDGKKDLLFRRSNFGNYYIWLMNGTSYTSEMAVSTGTSGLTFNTGWRYAGMHDFNSDGHTDLFLQNTNGTVAAWFLNRTVVTGSQNLNPNPIHSSWFAVGPK